MGHCCIERARRRLDDPETSDARIALSVSVVLLGSHTRSASPGGSTGVRFALARQCRPDEYSAPTGQLQGVIGLAVSEVLLDPRPRVQGDCHYRT